MLLSDVSDLALFAVDPVGAPKSTDIVSGLALFHVFKNVFSALVPGSPN